MLTASTQFDQTINSKVMTVGARLELDLPAGPTGDFTLVLQSVSLDCQNQTDLPDGVRDEAGFSNIGGSIVVSGRSPSGMSIADLLNPDNTASPLYRFKVKGTPIRFYFGVRPQGTAATELIRKLTGRIASYSLNHQTGEVTFTVVDLSQDWTDLPAIPAPITVPPYSAGLTSEFPLDQIIRAVNRTSSWPALRPSAVLSVGFRASLTPEVGAFYLDSPNGVPTFAPCGAASGMQTIALDNTSFTALYFTPSAPITTSAFVQFFVQGVTSSNPVAVVKYGDLTKTVIAGSPPRYSLAGISIAVTSTGVVITDDAIFGAPAYTWTTAIDATAHLVEVNLQVTSGTLNGTISIDGVVQAFSYSGPSVPTNAVVSITPKQANFGNPASTATIGGLQITTETAPATAAPFSPAAVLDPSLNPLTVVPPVAADAKAWDVIQQIAAAELGYARRDENGVFRFSNRQTLAAQAVARTITSAVSLKEGMVTNVGGGTESRRVRVPYTAWTFGAPTAVWTANSVIKVARKSTFAFTQQIDNLAAAVDLTSTVLPNTHSFSDGNTWHRASTEAAGITEHPGVSITLSASTGNSVLVTIVNNTLQDAYLVTPSNYSDLAAGSPALWIGGTPATAADEASIDCVYGAGDMTFAVSSNPYLQLPDPAAAVGNYLLNQLFYPVRDFTSVDIVPDSRIQVGDIVHLQDPTRSFIDEYVSVWGWSFDATFPTAGQSGGSWDMSLNVRALGPPGAWLGGIAGRSEAGVTTYAYD